MFPVILIFVEAVGRPSVVGGREVVVTVLLYGMNGGAPLVPLFLSNERIVSDMTPRYFSFVIMIVWWQSGAVITDTMVASASGHSRSS